MQHIYNCIYQSQVLSINELKKHINAYTSQRPYFCRVFTRVLLQVTQRHIACCREISFSATSPKLSDKETYPYFLRTLEKGWKIKCLRFQYEGFLEWGYPQMDGL